MQNSCLCIVRYFVCLIGYYILELIIFQWLIFGKIFGEKLESKYVGIFVIINDLTYIPMAVIFCLVRMVQLIVLCLISYIRPDLSIFPGYLDTMDHGHLSFVSNVRLTMQTEKQNVLQSIENEVQDDDIEIQEVYSNKSMVLNGNK